MPLVVDGGGSTLVRFNEKVEQDSNPAPLTHVAPGP
jgi:hypothetical protein